MQFVLHRGCQGCVGPESRGDIAMTNPCCHRFDVGSSRDECSDMALAHPMGGETLDSGLVHEPVKCAPYVGRVDGSARGGRKDEVIVDPVVGFPPSFLLTVPMLLER